MIPHNAAMSELRQQLAARDEQIAQLKRELEEARKPKWTCFHCGFETADPAEAAAHFGDRDDAEEFTPLCRWWQRMDPEERGQVLQDTIQQLNEERDENSLLRTRIEGLEYQVGSNEADIASRFKGARTITEARSVSKQLAKWHNEEQSRAETAEARVKELEQDQAKIMLRASSFKSADGVDLILSPLVFVDLLLSQLGSTQSRLAALISAAEPFAEYFTEAEECSKFDDNRGRPENLKWSDYRTLAEAVRKAREEKK